MSRLSSLGAKIANEITIAINSGEFGSREHLSAQKLADRFGVSRSPIREALKILEDQGYVEQAPNRGFFTRKIEARGADAIDRALPFESASDYQTIAEDWLTNKLPSEVTEKMLRERYGLTKVGVQDVLTRAAREGWAERKAGYGWRLLPVAKTSQSFEQIYKFRMIVEPAAMLAPGYQVDWRVLAEQKEIHERMLGTEIETVPGERLMIIGATFHEELIKFSGNLFLYQALVRVNQMRRLLEYRLRIDRRRLFRQYQEHLDIIRILEQGDVVEAAYVMRRHLDGALSTKSPVLIKDGVPETPDEDDRPASARTPRQAGRAKL